MGLLELALANEPIYITIAIRSQLQIKLYPEEKYSTKRKDDTFLRFRNTLKLA
ncbi:MAG: hypothetical protein ACI9EW_002516 [Cellvibrionaceae bacterium]|jgi:hypothetical protein